jgi:protein phosphatase
VCSSDLQHLLKLNSIFDLFLAVQPILDSEPTVLRLTGPIHVVGDIHGNIDDLLRIFAKCQYPPDSTYLFLGDYVDRGDFGVEVMVLLLALKLKFPRHVYLLRGNHETFQVSKSYGFLIECRSKFNTRLFNEMNYIWTYLPIAAVVEDAIFCVHGGISRGILYLEELERTPKPGEVPSGPVTDLLWSDPSEDEIDYMPNSRGLGCRFSENALMDFLDNNQLQFLVRSHQSCNGIQLALPHCLTVFSTSDYAGQGNSAGVITISVELQIRKHILTPVNQKAERRVIFPGWLIDELEEGKQATDGDSSPGDITV